MNFLKKMLIILSVIFISSCYNKFQNNHNLRLEIKNTFISHNESVNKVSFNPNPRLTNGIDLISVDDDGVINLWNSYTNKLAYKISERQDGYIKAVLDAKFSKHGRYFATAGFDKKIILWQSINGKLNSIISKKQEEEVNSIDFDNDSKSIASANSDGYIKIWNVVNGHIMQNIPYSTKSNNRDYPLNIDYFNSNYKKSFKNEFLVSGGSDNQVKIWNAKKGILIRTLGNYTEAKHSAPITSVKFSTNNNYVLSASKDSTIKLWDFLNNKLIYTINLKNGWVNEVSFSPDEKIFASAGSDGTLSIWHTETGKNLKSHKLSHSINSVSFSYIIEQYPNNYFKLATAGDDRYVRIWKVWN